MWSHSPKIQGIDLKYLLLLALVTALLTQCGAESKAGKGSAADLKAGVAAPDPVASGKTVRQGPKILDPKHHKIGRRLRDLSFVDVDGQTGNLYARKSTQATVIALTDTTCPIAQKYAPALVRLEKEYGPKGVRFLFVNLIEDEDSEAIAAFRKQHPFEGSYIHDATHEWGLELGAQCTTDVFIVDRANTLVYRGAIDDRIGLGYIKHEAEMEYFRDAMDAVLKNHPPLVQATWAPGCVLDLTPSPTPAATAEITYHNRISRIFQRNCNDCHHQGGVAPFPLETFKDVRKKRGMIRYSIEEGIMPPWFADNHSGPWVNDRRLLPEDQEALFHWLENGMPEGDPADAPVRREYPDGWRIGEPEVIYQIPEVVEVPAEGVMPYMIYRIETEFPEDRWVQAVEVRPTSIGVVHHVTVHVLPKIVEKGGKNWQKKVGRHGFFIGYVPGADHRIYPKHMARRLPAGATLFVRIHYTTNGTPTTDQTRIGLRFRKDVPPYEVRCEAVQDRDGLRIPPYADNHTHSSDQKSPWDVTLLSLMPHMHLRGKSFHYEVFLPNGEVVKLLDVDNYDFNWQFLYVFEDPPSFPQGSIVRATGVFDNSRNNPANPDPSKEIVWGQQTVDEMCIGYVEYYKPNKLYRKELTPAAE